MSAERPFLRRTQRRPQPPTEGLLHRLLQRLIDPIDALTAAIYSILMVLTFTLAFAVINHAANYDMPLPAGFGRDVFFAAFGAALAWGLIDGLMHTMLSMLERGEQHHFLQKLQDSRTDNEALSIISDKFDPLLRPIAGERKRKMLYEEVLEHLRDSHPRPVGFQLKDFIAGLASSIVAIIAVVPSLIPLWFLSHYPLTALLISNLTSFIILFFLGYRWGAYSGASRWKTGFLLFLLGAILMAIAIPLGG